VFLQYINWKWENCIEIVVCPEPLEKSEKRRYKPKSTYWVVINKFSSGSSESAIPQGAILFHLAEFENEIVTVARRCTLALINVMLS
jgi:hypothetical protein